MPPTSPPPGPAPHAYPPAARGNRHARDVARLVNPLIADALALGRRIERCAPPPTAGDDRHALSMFAVFADQLRASAVLMDACVGPVEHGARAGLADAHAGRAVPADDIPESSGDGLRRVLDGEDRMARHLRRAIATCDHRGDDWTADRLEEVLDEITLQRGYLSALLPEAAR